MPLGSDGKETNSTLIKTDVKSIKQFLELLEKGEKEKEARVEAFRNDIRKKADDEIHKRQLKDVEELEDKITDLMARGIKLSQRQMEDLAKQQAKQKESSDRKALIEYYKEYGKQAEKQRKKEEKQEKKDLAVAKLRSRIDENGEEKSTGRKLVDNWKASMMEKYTVDFKKTLESSFKLLSDAMKALGNEVNKAMSTYANYQSGINARLQGSDKTFSKIEKSLTAVSYSPLLKADDLYSNLAELVKEGIVSNVEQRAFLMTIKDNIATTFDANNSAIKRIIRLQQTDTTASRLGMEAYLTSLMNQLVENTEYLSTSFDNVQSALLEASSLMSASSSTEFEYEVQKWLGAMTGVGLSDNTSNSLAQALGYLGSGNIDALSSSALQNLLVMSSARAGLSYADLLSGGLNATDTSRLLQSLVGYVQEIWNNSKNNNVVMSQFASTFGLTVSDIRAIANLDAETVKSLGSNILTYNGMYEELSDQMGQVASRMSIATIMDNLFSNFAYSTGATLASNPVTYATWKIADFIGNTTSGINIPSAFVVGTGVDMNTTIDNLVKLGLIGVSTFKNIGGLINGVASIGDGARLLEKMNIDSSHTAIKRGEIDTTRNRGESYTLSSKYIGNHYERII